MADSFAPCISVIIPTYNRRALIRRAVDSALDQTETAMTDDLFAPCSGIAQAQELYARSAGAESTLFLTGGSTAGMLAMVLSSVREGGRLILPRNAHHSAMSACVWGDIEPVFVSPRVRVDGSKNSVARFLPAHLWA